MLGWTKASNWLCLAGQILRWAEFQNASKVDKCRANHFIFQIFLQRWRKCWEEIIKTASTSRSEAHRRNTDTSLQAIKKSWRNTPREDTSNPPEHNKQFFFLLLLNAFQKRNDWYNSLLLNSYETFLPPLISKCGIKYYFKEESINRQ
jgi:hypothetical protein